MIEARSVSKSYAHALAVDDLSFTVASGLYPQAMFFAVGLPLLYLLIFVSRPCFSTSSLRRSPSNTSTTRSSQHSTPTPADCASSGWTSS